MKKIFPLLIGFLIALTGCTEQIASPEIQQSPDPIEQLITTMSIEEKVAQMFIARCPSDNAVALATEYQPGGYILFANDFKNSTPATFKDTVSSYHQVVKIPMFIAVDEEGGIVNRASKFSQFRDIPFASPQSIYQEGGLDAIRKDAKEKSKFLLSLGINLNFAPVCDISDSPDDFIYERTLGLPAEETAQYVKVVISEMNSAKIGSVLKHFPGYGGNTDTHTGMAIDKRPYQTFVENDFLPFKAGVESGASMILVSHTIVEAMDPELPASLSPKVHDILRKELNFDGIIITDDIAMDAIGEYTNNTDAAILAVAAGNDIVCCTDFTEQIPAVINAVKSGKIPMSQIDQSVTRILRCKQNLGILTF